ncbi:hypothetical protein [Actinoplanes sp. OR16]|uniref:hypothetical protein n=1 Tax=Actinoplanes sp. OR16 TaxID=946334 RepID=UPI000FD8BD2A|nr:hypothetical protein [Actinoplanes sp. OR16]
MGSLALGGTPAFAGGEPYWEVEVGKIPATEYTRDAKVLVGDSLAALVPYVNEKVVEKKIDPVLADVASRYFDGARLKSKDDAKVVFEHLEPLQEYLEDEMSERTVPKDASERAHVRALVETLTAVRLLADAAIQDAEAVVGPFRETPQPTPAPDAKLLKAAFEDIKEAKKALAEADEQLREADPEDALEEALPAWKKAFGVLALFGITYEGDRDADGVVDVVELRFGSSPLLIDSDGDGLTDKFEIYTLAGLSLPGNPDTDGDGTPDGQEDVDGDGLTNLREQELGTSPTEADTDGDGVDDGTEVAQGRNPLVADPRNDPPLSGGAPPIVPAPTLLDTDGDGLLDVEEQEILTDVNNVDTDGDGLSDGVEVGDWGINPLVQDTDGDALRDDYETVHVEDQGLDPARPDPRISKWTYVTDFLLGMFAGDFVPKDSMAWLAGNLCSGGLSAIPVVGWILGGLADLRDTIAGLINGDWVSAGLSILGVVPYVGDAVAIPGKAARFVLKYVHRLQETLKFVTKYDKIPDSVKDLALELILGQTYNFLIGDDAGFSAAASRFTRNDVRTMSRGDRTRWADIQDAMSDTNHVDGPEIPAQYNWRDGENAVRAILTGPCEPDYVVDTPGYPSPRSRTRKPDCAERQPDGSAVLHEVKTGVPTWTESLIDECLKDAWSLTAAGKAAHNKNISGIHWHFVAHAQYNSVGIHPPLLECLKNNKIPFTIHAPGA